MLNRTSFFKVLLAAILFFTFVVYVIQTLNSNLRRHQEVTNLRIDIHYKSKNLVIRKKKTKKIKERSTFSVRKLPQAITDRLLEKKQSIVKDFTTSTTFEMPFDLDTVNTSFIKCFEESLDLEAYNKGYNELYNFFSMLGTVFNFIAADVREKIDILENYRTGDSPNKEHYVKTEDMMLYEIDVNKETGAALHGSRTLLRLHRALKFTMLFLERLVEMEDKGKVSDMAYEVYAESLSNYHSWLVRNGAKLAMYALPYKRDFMKKIVPPGEEESVVADKIRHGVKSLHNVYESMEALYTKHDLHGLP